MTYICIYNQHVYIWSRVPCSHPPPMGWGGYDAPVVVYIHTYTYIHTYIPTYLPTYMHTYIIYIYTYIHIHIHIYIHIHSISLPQPKLLFQILVSTKPFNYPQKPSNICDEHSPSWWFEFREKVAWNLP